MSADYHRWGDIEIVPCHPVLSGRKMVRYGKLVPCRSDRIDPVPEGKDFLPVDKVGHIDSPIGQVVLDVVDFVQEVTPVRVCNAREPALVPCRYSVLEDLVALSPDGAGGVERHVLLTKGPLRIFVSDL